ncbi:Uncharacterized protein DBV15_12454 [Temnothorax longispinosus]|uniref:HAT C-terminal dimerisation domain-containing protein n=1 Tax=Temnothorax longispinosus TaxID=300112 RepID=A0A4S2KPQ9_9HYME|nr:Uncharacterized protein DBV15_12454 [Temnothorax longispinosus]
MLDSWNKIHLIKWNNTTETKTFWYEVILYKDAAGQNPFYDLAMFALKMLSLPHSDADVERLFSQLNLIKNKLKNRLEADTVKDIICIRAGLKRYNKVHSTQYRVHSLLRSWYALLEEPGIEDSGYGNKCGVTV